MPKLKTVCVHPNMDNIRVLKPACTTIKWMYGVTVSTYSLQRSRICRTGIRWFGVSFFCVLLPMIMAHADVPDGKALFAQGVQASREGDHQRAGQLFSAAMLAGYNVPALHYNLGVTYYRLGNLQKSKSEFQKLLGNKQLSPIACYNLGLIAAKSGQDRVAINYFGITYNISENPELRQLSKLALERYETQVEEISSKDPAEVESGTDGFVSLAMVRDNNVNLVNDELQIATEQADTARELLLSVNSILLGKRSDGLQLSVLADVTRYNDALISKDFDSSQYHAALSYLHEQNSLQMRYEIGYDSIDFGGQEFQRITSAAIRSRLYLDNANYMRLAYQYMAIDSNDQLYQFLDGNSQKLSLDFTFPSGSHKYRFGLIVESNNREDELNQAPGSSSVLFRSYSAKRATARAAYYYRISRDWRFKIDMRYRRSLYNDEDRIILASIGEIDYQRIDNQQRILSGLTMNLSKNWKVSLTHEYVDNDSNRLSLVTSNATAETASYTRGITSLSLDWYF